ncbi:MAG: hypothetical protein HY293_04375 [Planctomycetes bacterium]|nr:hypothetical protein [Planctomycetota bacterium]
MKRLCVLLFAAGAPAVLAHEHAPRVLSPHNADAYSMKTFAEYPRWRDLKGDAKVYEVYKYLADRRTGIFPMGAGAWEGKDPVYDFGWIRDPVKMINVYSAGYCDMLGPTMAGVMKDMGIGPSRTLNLPGWGHVVAEVFYDGKWHYLDLDVRAAFRRKDGTLASMEEAKKEPALWKGPNSPLFFPLDNLENTRKVYAETAVQVRHGVNMGGHTMDYVLRRGETLTRWWNPQEDRWNHAEAYNKKPFPRELIEKEPRGPKCKHPSFTIHTHGNGRFVYAPDLTDKSADFADGAYEARNVKPGPSGLVPEKPGESFAIFEVRSPYVIVPRVGDLDSTADDREASVVKLDAADVAASVSLDNGLSWAPAPLPDLTPFVSGRYQYLLKIALTGPASVVRSMVMTTWVQVQPASLPSLRKGKNEMRYVTGDHYGLNGHVVELRTNGSDRADFLKYLQEPPADFDPARTTSRARGPFVVNEPRDFKEFYRAEVPAGQNHWHYNADVEVKLEAPAKTVFLKYVGDPGVNNLRIFAHGVEEAPPAASPVRITHAWKEKGLLKTKTVVLEKPGPYEITTEDDPADESVEISVGSVK